MRVYKFSILLVFITLAALLYVHQQVGLLKVSYMIDANEKKVATLLDQNRGLVYNVSRLKSPVYLEQKFLAAKKDFGIPKQWQVVAAESKINEQPEKAVANNKVRSRPFDFLKIFGRPQEALAKTIK